MIVSGFIIFYTDLNNFCETFKVITSTFMVMFVFFRC